MIQNKNKTERYDRIVIGAGIFGLYAALKFAQNGYRVLVIDKEKEAFTAASRVNQARIHGGYHYPRSLSTAIATAEYQARFTEEFSFAVDTSLEQIYAIAGRFSYTDKDEFEKFCHGAHIPCETIDHTQHFNPSMVTAAYRTEEYVFDADAMKSYLMAELERLAQVSFAFGTRIVQVQEIGAYYEIETIDTECDRSNVKSDFVLNVTYAGLNNLIELFGHAPLPLKYEYAEMVLCAVPDELDRVGLTVMDGPFFSLMPYGRTGLHSLSAVTYTPHVASTMPIDVTKIEECTRFAEMNQLAKTYLREGVTLEYKGSIFATKTILRKTELDDARPTSIMVHSKRPYFASVLSGKLNTIFDLDELCTV